MKGKRKPIQIDRRGWRIRDFVYATGLSAAFINEKIAEGRIRTAKIDGTRIILESPEEYLERHEERREASEL